MHGCHGTILNCYQIIYICFYLYKYEISFHQGAFWSLMCGLVVGAVRFIVEFSYGTPPGCGSDKEYKLPAIISQVHYLHFGCLLFGLTAIIAIVISLLTKPINPRKV